MQSEPSPAPDLRILIEAEHEALLRLRKRQYALEALVGEIERVTRGETFDIHNDIRWVQMLDYRDKNIIDLASWAKFSARRRRRIRPAHPHRRGGHRWCHRSL